MRISTRGQYSLEALLYLASLPSGEYASIRALSEATGISDGYLEQLFIGLKKQGIVQGIRGARGGYVVGRDPSEITAGDVLRAVEGTLEPVACLSAGTCPSEAACITRHTWAHLYREIRDVVDSVTLADLAREYDAELMAEKGYTI